MDMNNGDAFNDMPEEYREYREDIQGGKMAVNVGADDPLVSIGDSEADKAIADGKPRWMYLEQPGWQYVIVLGRKYVGVGGQAGIMFREAIDRASATQEPAILVALESGLEVLPYGETPPPAVPEKPKAVASLRFEYEGGVWEHMAERIQIKNHPYEGYDHRGNRTYMASRDFAFTLPGGHRLGLVPEMPEIGRLRVVMLDNGETYEDEAIVDKREDMWDGDLSFTKSITFRMKRDEKPSYTPDPLPDGLPTLNRCPDCDNTLEQRSMPDGIEEWCGECNMKVEVATNAGNWESHDWMIRVRDIDKKPSERWVHCSQCGVNAMEGNTTLAPCSFFTDTDREVWGEDTEAEGPMHPRYDTGELQRIAAITEEIRAILREGDALYLITAKRGYVVTNEDVLNFGDDTPLMFVDHRKQSVILDVFEVRECGEAKIGLASWWMLMENKLANGTGE